MSSAQAVQSRILIVDDDAMNRETLSTIFGAAGYGVDVAATGTDALERVRDDPPDLLLLDVCLGAESGFDVLKRIKTTPELQHVFVVMITGHRTSPEDQATGLDMGADGYLVRPIDKRELISRVGAFLRHKQTIDSLRASERRFRKIIDRNPDAILIVDQSGIISFANPASEQLFRLSVDDLMEQVFGFPVVLDENTEIEIVHRDGPASFAEMRTIDIEWDDSFSLLTSIRDITERKDTEAKLLASEARFRSLFDQAADGIVVHDEHGSIIDVNEAFCRMVGYAKEELTRMSLSDVWTDESRLVTREGASLVTEVSTKEVRLGGEQRAFHAIVRDVSERAEARNDLERELEEKRVLLRELYHRTKNNMQVISSMLELKKLSIGDRQVGSMLDDINSRILAMSLVHRELYESQSLSSLDLNDYLARLSRLLESLYSHADGRVAIECTCPGHMVLIDIAVPIGQIVTELVSNSMKHAFNDRSEGHIILDVQTVEPDLLVLDYSDDGVGFPDKFDIGSHANLGLKTVSLMVESQLDGEMAILPSERGARVRIEVREKGYESRVEDGHA